MNRPHRGMSEAERARFYLSRYREDPSGCWVFLGCIVPEGYGVAGGFGYAHRFFYEQMVAPIPAGLQIDHLCRNRACVRPDHLEPVTQHVNALRGRGWSGRNAAKTHCKRGHEFTTENTVVSHSESGQQRRRCRTCLRYLDRRWREAKAATRNH